MKPLLPRLQVQSDARVDPRERRAALRVAERILEAQNPLDHAGCVVPAPVVAAWVLRMIGGYAIEPAELIDHAER